MNSFLNFLFPENLSRSAIREVVQSSNSFITDKICNKLRNKSHKMHLAKIFEKGHINTRGYNLQIFQGIKQVHSLEKMTENQGTTSR